MARDSHADVVVGRLLRGAAGVAGDGRVYALDALKNRLGAPEAARRERRLLGTDRRRSRRWRWSRRFRSGEQAARPGDGEDCDAKERESEPGDLAAHDRYSNRGCTDSTTYRRHEKQTGGQTA